MGNKAKKAAKAKRLQKKRAAKTAEKAKYTAYRDSGINLKSKRVALRTKRQRRRRAHSHPHGACGNLGCLQCSTAAKEYKIYTFFYGRSRR